MAPPKSVVIVGGSLAGLLHGLYLKRHGSNVVILEQDPKNLRSSHNAGICFGPAAQEILSKYDDTGLQTSIPSVNTRIAYRKKEELLRLNIRRNNTSWGLMYRILRANFDGLASDAVPSPPPARDGDGKADYRSGKKVTNLEYVGRGGVTVCFIGEDGKTDSIAADMVIGADGLHSTIRTLVEAPVKKEYSGYVTWRGTVPENELPEAMAEYFARRITLNLLSRSYIVIYVIPRDAGSFEPGSRLVNWVWYQNFADPSPELNEALTDINGQTHGNTVPVGLVRPEIWKHYLAARIGSMAAPVAKLIGSSEKVFVTKVNDSLCDKAVHHSGKVVLVGDALTTFRPHFALATEQAARHCLGLGKVWNGEMSFDHWEKEATGHATKTWLMSRVLGMWFLRGWVELLGTLWVYVVALVSLKLGGDGGWHGVVDVGV
ncbi:zeaxanthin epoxidase, chloroplastic [Podospora fimiseda]|uniref:Zeaxanthin epoxidase, chloroplastic n=1 Tax=Podospora fimiseda TaxID=252190 RepID=A0AAN7BF27_9PEZI|nr:zeaxanthin epoxidase, chloroplastic [Podospora fimiseda]